MTATVAILQYESPTTTDVDLAYLSAELVAWQMEDSTTSDGVSPLMVEILSRKITCGELDDKIDTYLDAGVGLVWILEPRRRTVTVYRPGAEPELFNVRQELSGEPQLPGFRMPVVRLFE